MNSPLFLHLPLGLRLHLQPLQLHNPIPAQMQRLVNAQPLGQNLTGFYPSLVAVNSSLWR
jgi:hypothetical protein